MSVARTGLVDENLVMDDDVEQMDHDALVAEVKRLRAGIRNHRDSSGHDLCWHHPGLWSLLPDDESAQPVVPDWPQFLRGCVAYRASLDDQLPSAPRSTDEHGGRTRRR
jgi:hypothetical protein